MNSLFQEVSFKSYLHITEDETKLHQDNMSFPNSVMFSSNLFYNLKRLCTNEVTTHKHLHP